MSCYGGKDLPSWPCLNFGGLFICLRRKNHSPKTLFPHRLLVSRLLPAVLRSPPPRLTVLPPPSVSTRASSARVAVTPPSLLLTSLLAAVTALTSAPWLLPVPPLSSPANNPSRRRTCATRVSVLPSALKCTFP